MLSCCRTSSCSFNAFRLTDNLYGCISSAAITVMMLFKTPQITKVPEKLLSYAVRCKNLTVSNARTVLLTPEIYVSQNVYEQLLDLLLEAVRGAREFA